MTPKERLFAILEGVTPDRTPVYTQIPFALTETGFKPGAFHGYADYDNWRELDPLYWKLVRRMYHDCDNPFIWRPPCMGNEQFFISPDATRKLPEEPDGDRLVITTEATIDRTVLTQRKAVMPGTGHTWEVEHYCKGLDDARRLLDHPWKGAPVDIEDFSDCEEALGDRGVIWVTIPSPLMVVCRLFDPLEFLVYSRTERNLIDTLCSVAGKRIEAALAVLLEAGAGPVIRFGGAEHATPPLMSPDDFDRLVVEHDKPLVELCKRYGRKVAYHCHGNLRHALKRFAEMGVDMTDPVETLPDGDVSLSEAREIAGEGMVFAGNIQCRELFDDSVPASTIKNRTTELLEHADHHRLLVTTTGSILEKVSERTYEKYSVLIDTVLQSRAS